MKLFVFESLVMMRAFLNIPMRFQLVTLRYVLVLLECRGTGGLLCWRLRLVIQAWLQFTARYVSELVKKKG